MPVDVRCVKFQDGSKTLRRKKRKEYRQKFYHIFHQFRDLNICFEIKAYEMFDMAR